ncbi:hypothetical protein JTB14_010515 [Gonioctena quinquepunctata]|nr:hypothetical protein JTB14_010515 [Gonioctena quinquepunctata]
MSTSEISFMQSKNLNLLLKQQKINQLEETESDSTDNERDNTKHDRTQCESFENQMGESSCDLQQKALCENYDLLETLLDHILQHVECFLLEAKSSIRLVHILNVYGLHENRIDEPVAESLKKLCEKPDFEILEEIKTKLFVSLNHYEHIKEFRQEYDKRKNDYKLALKNFKIILEVMNINRKTLTKLRKQFDEVLINCQHCRCVLNQEMPFILTERKKILDECLKLLGDEYGVWVGHRVDLSNLLTKLGDNVDSNENFSGNKDKLALI